MFFKRSLAAGIAALAAVLPASGAATADTAQTEPCGGTSPEVVHDWQRVLLRTVYTEHSNPVPIGVPYLGFTSLGIEDAVARACERADRSPVAAAAVAGHGVLVEYFPASIEVIRRTLGEETSLELRSSATGTARVYPNLTTIEYDAFHARIWSGLHFRDAMQDAYKIGHRTARRVIRALADGPAPA